MKKLLLIAMIGMFAGSVFADDDINDERFWTPIQINLASPIGILWADRDVYGLRANILYGHSIDVYGLDFGLVGANRGSFWGASANFFNFVDGVFRGAQFGLLGNFTVKTAYGVQFGGIVNWGLDDGAGVEVAFINLSGAYTGVQFGFVNWDDGLDNGLALAAINVAKADFEGGALGFSNYCKGNMRGCQIGVFNMVFGHSDGLQIGIFNASDDHSGAQIGLLNLNANGALHLMPFINVNFR